MAIARPRCRPFDSAMRLSARLPNTTARIPPMIPVQSTAMPSTSAATANPFVVARSTGGGAYHPPAGGGGGGAAETGDDVDHERPGRGGVHADQRARVAQRVDLRLRGALPARDDRAGV